MNTACEGMGASQFSFSKTLVENKKLVSKDYPGSKKKFKKKKKTLKVLEQTNSSKKIEKGPKEDT